MVQAVRVVMQYVYVLRTDVEIRTRTKKLLKSLHTSVSQTHPVSVLVSVFFAMCDSHCDKLCAMTDVTLQVDGQTDLRRSPRGGRSRNRYLPPGYHSIPHRHWVIHGV